LRLLERQRLLVGQWLLAVLWQRRRRHRGGHGLVGDCLRWLLIRLRLLLLLLLLWLLLLVHWLARRKRVETTAAAVAAAAKDVVLETTAAAAAAATAALIVKVRIERVAAGRG
jgi:hypothetical protein